MAIVNLATALGLGRAVFGGAAWAAPKLVAERGGMPGAGANGEARYMTRLFGSRDLMVGLATALPATQAQALRLGIVLDLFDTAAGVLAGRDGVSARQSRLYAAVAGGYAVAGIVAARRR
ncbi:MAG: hypothetical protein ACTHMS_21735 [Jatrophihabitans sp.]|uniref:hypothetical protein n=1 Tax=Jatrophihabitans sp. TaxID=1932789 RepID=UPI003F801CED